jgi:branched-chain amino acid aminotransferase
VLALAGELGIHAKERPFTLFDLWTAREAFMCGTMAEIVPISTVDGRPIGTGVPGPMTVRISAAYHTLVRSTGTPIRRAVPALTAEGVR